MVTMAKKENSRYIYAMFSEVLLLALSLSSMYTRAALNILRKLRIRKQKNHLLGLSIITASFQSFLPLLIIKDSIDVYITAHTHSQATLDKHKGVYL